MPMPTKAVVLYDQTSAANTALDTGPVDVSSYDQILVEYLFSAAAAAAPFIVVRDNDAGGSAGMTLANRGVAATATQAFLSVGVGGSGSFDSAGVATVWPAVALPLNIRAQAAAAGAAVTTRIRIIGRRNHSGPDVSSNPD